jgi:hypothetical protein
VANLIDFYAKAANDLFSTLRPPLREIKMGEETLYGFFDSLMLKHRELTDQAEIVFVFFLVSRTDNAPGSKGIYSIVLDQASEEVIKWRIEHEFKWFNKKFPIALQP